ncbi:molybdopterin molybdenumtransferase MoeA [Flavobacteriaceae bacterium R38]|nr:molybdopterin molybdenumtransferase MoeA [Flavobacteriaceae bacterium R38]
MITVENALRLIDNTIVKTSETEVIDVINSYGYILATDIYSPINMPPFRQSAMDGYALHLGKSDTYSLISEVKAGDNSNPSLKPGEAARIFTGAPVPDTANAVIMQEKVKINNNDSITIETETKKGSNIRAAGEQIKEGELALSEGTLITSAAIGFLSTLGITKIDVYKKPSIAIVVTGNELVDPGKDLEYGEIYESNAITLKSTLESLGFNNITLHRVKDDYNKTRDQLKTCIENNDTVIISGGISVGDYDFVGKALAALDVEEVFYKVKQKPGKPLFFGKKNATTIFALPGNPASALSCLYVYVVPALRKFIGYADYFLEKELIPSDSSYEKNEDRVHLLKALIKNNSVTILNGQASSMIHSFALANALVYLPGDCKKVQKGEKVEVIRLP